MIRKYYTQDLILMNKSSSTGDYWSTSTGPTYTTGVAIKAAVNQLSANEEFNYGKIGYDAQYKCFADPSSEIYAGRRARWDSDDYEIITQPKNTLQMNHHFRFLLKVVK